MLLSQGEAPDLDGFEAYLHHRGLSPNTIRAYLQWVGTEEPTAALRDTELAPKSRRLIQAALRSYGHYSGDTGLLTDVSDIKLPVAARRRPQLPLPKPCYFALRQAIDEDPELDEPTRAHLGIMAGRGLRKGDVLRIQRDQVTRALDSGVLAFLAKGQRQLEFGVTQAYKPYLEILAECFEDDPSAQTVAHLIGHGTGAEQRPPIMLRRVAEQLPLSKWKVQLVDIRCHVLRRTYATLFYEACGFDIMKLKSHMCWASLETASGYVDHSKREELDKIASGMFK